MATFQLDCHVRSVRERKDSGSGETSELPEPVTQNAITRESAVAPPTALGVRVAPQVGCRGAAGLGSAERVCSSGRECCQP